MRRMEGYESLSYKQSIRALQILLMRSLMKILMSLLYKKGCQSGIVKAAINANR